MQSHLATARPSGLPRTSIFPAIPATPTLPVGPSSAHDAAVAEEAWSRPVRLHPAPEGERRLTIFVRAAAAPVPTVPTVLLAPSPDLAPAASALASAVTARPLQQRTVTHLVPPWHRTDPTDVYGTAGNLVLGAAVASLTGSVVSSVCEIEDIQSSPYLAGAISGMASGMIVNRTLQTLGWFPLERPMYHLHRAAGHLWKALWRPSVQAQLEAIVADACLGELTPDGLEGVLEKCEAAIAGYPADHARRQGWPDIVRNLIPEATGGSMGTKADRVRQMAEHLSTAPR